MKIKHNLGIKGKNVRLSVWGRDRMLGLILIINVDEHNRFNLFKVITQIQFPNCVFNSTYPGGGD